MIQLKNANFLDAPPFGLKMQQGKPVKMNRGYKSLRLDRNVPIYAMIQHSFNMLLFSLIHKWNKRFTLKGTKAQKIISMREYWCDKKMIMQGRYEKQTLWSIIFWVIYLKIGNLKQNKRLKIGFVIFLKGVPFLDFIDTRLFKNYIPSGI